MPDGFGAGELGLAGFDGVAVLAGAELAVFLAGTASLAATACLAGAVFFATAAFFTGAAFLAGAASGAT